MERLIPDIILKGGPVFTAAAPLMALPAQAVAVRGEHIVAAGAESEVLPLAGPGTRVVDLGGRLLIPGFIDAHVHLAAYGASLDEVDCKYPAVRSIRDIQDKIRERAANQAAGWVKAGGYDQSRLDEGRHPTRHDLDAACPDRPVVLSRTCGHIAVVNTRALELAGVRVDGPDAAGLADPPGGRFDRDPAGCPNGVLREAALMILAGLADPTLSELVGYVAAGSREFARRGITSAHEAGTGPQAFRAYQQARAEGALQTRMYLMLDPSDPAFHEAVIACGLGTGFGDDWLRLGPLKLMVDGSSSGPTAATREPYSSDPGSRGILYFDQDETDRRFAAGAAAGLQLTAHAVGDRAVEMVVTALERSAGSGPAGLRHRIEHCAMTDPALIDRIGRAGIVPVLQPVFLYEFGDGYVRNYGPERAARMFAAGSYRRAGIPFALSTDCPVTYPDPMLNLYCAVTRRTMSGAVVGPEERVTLVEALYGYTMGGAYAAHEEDRKGSIEPGKLADLVVLSGNPFAAVGAGDFDALREMRAACTIVGGRVVHDELDAQDA